ncbi:hypothetical protein VAT7223_00427 [Vibrio atlanticus]|uniref:Uncharacterized protein n=1 Tax=Vibrio atlanticus TaxID=693153 RepID=A0A1C3IHS4_9VIBR|nr:hypothetical protein VAT7223_00427 [Vibrio atlanticus]
MDFCRQVVSRKLNYNSQYSDEFYVIITNKLTATN